jgi:hypothetical protein
MAIEPSWLVEKLSFWAQFNGITPFWGVAKTGHDVVALLPSPSEQFRVAVLARGEQVLIQASDLDGPEPVSRSGLIGSVEEDVEELLSSAIVWLREVAADESLSSRLRKMYVYVSGFTAASVTGNEDSRREACRIYQDLDS